jgi:lysophospholipase L1-like esterase
MSNRDLNTPVGLTDTIETFGDSLIAGTGGTALHLLLQARMPGRLFLGHGIGGQTAEQISARQGGNPTPVQVTLTGNAFAGRGAVSATVTNQLISTPSDNTTRVISGSVNGIQCYLTRTATGTAPSQVETYNITPAYTTTAAVPAGSVFIPDDGFNALNSIQILWLGRNNVPLVTGVAALVAGCVGIMALPRRFVVMGILNALNEPTGSANNNAIVAANATLAAAYPGQFVAVTPPTAAEMTAVGYTPTTQDNTDIANGTFPTGLRFDNVHLTTTGYQIIANRISNILTTQKW